MTAPTTDRTPSQYKGHSAAVPGHMARGLPRPILGGAGLAGLLALVLVWAPTPPAPAATASAEQRPLGSVTALAWTVQTPVGRRLVLRPDVSVSLSKRVLRGLRATKPRLTGSFKARIVTVPVRGRGRTVAVVSRRARGVALRASAARSVLGRRLRLKRWVLSRQRTAIVKRAAKRHRLAITISARYRVKSTHAGGRTAVTPTRSQTITLPLSLRRQRARGGNLRQVASTFRQLLRRVGRLQIACVTRGTILRQLRSTYSTVVSGDRSGAAVMLQAWIRDAEAMRAAGLLSGEQSTMLGSDLGRLLDGVGSGQSKRVERVPRWRSLPGCGPARAQVAQTLATIIVRRVVKRVRKAVVRWVFSPYAATTRNTFRGIRHVIKAEWPDDADEPSVEAQIPQNDTAQPSAESVLDDLKVQLDSFLNWGECCLATNPGNVASAWNSTLKNFKDNRWRFQLGPPYYSQSYQVELLGLFSEYINMYLQLLREGVVTGPRWGLTPETTLSLENQIRAELNPNDPASAMSYTKRVYDAGLALEGSSSDPQTDFARNNDYKREMQLQVLDFRDIWRFQDPMAYPYGDPSFRQNRIIYSDAVGSTTQAFSPPPNPSSPLSALTAWTTRVTTGSHANQNWLTAIQADNSPQVGARTGAAGGTPSTYSVAPGAKPGPVVQVDTTSDRKSTSSPQLIGTAKFYFGDGTSAVPGGDFYQSANTASWAFEDEVLATAKIMGSYPMTSSTAVGDSAVLGFRQADSFSASWKGSLPGNLRAPNPQACLAVEPVPVSGTTTGSRANGAALQMRDCGTGWEQIWRYVDYNDPNDSSDDDAQRDLNVYAGTMCAAPRNGATAPGTPVQVNYCDGTPAQKWTRDAAAGSITHDQSKLCLERVGGAVSSGTPIQLNTCNGSDAQKWTWPR